MKSSTISIAPDALIQETLGHGAGCGCPMCTGYVERGMGDPSLIAVTTTTEDATADTRAGTTASNGKPIWTADQAAAYLNRTGANWITGPNPAHQSDTNLQEITFGFHDSQASLERNGYVYTDGSTDANGETNYYGLSEYFQFGAFNEAQKGAARIAMSFWDDVAAVSFRETNIDDADITFGNLTNSPGTQAYSRVPLGTVTSNAFINEQIRDIVGDVWVSNSQASNFQFGPNGYGQQTLTHEIGHSLGLSHPGNYNFGPGFTANYANGAEYYQDVRNYSIMSYWNPRDTGDGASRDYDFNIMTIGYGVTPMVHDILAIQKMYGADMTTRTGNTVYGFNSTAGKDAFDFTINRAPIMSIWDAGGTDTLDASGYRVDQDIDLTPGSLSSIGGVSYSEIQDGTLTFEKVNANRAAMGYAPVARSTYDGNVAALAGNAVLGRMTNNVGIAYGAIIENAVGGSGNDRIIGNTADNVLTGNAGNDVLFGFDGNDTLFGGIGNDSLDGGIGNDSLDGGNGSDTLLGGNGDDLMFGGAGDDSLDGGNGDDRLFGGDGNDILRGAAGNDYVDGGLGDDSLFGGSGADTLLGSFGNDTLSGGGDSDLLDGGDGNDSLGGDLGNDTLLGGNGRDTLMGGAGDDLLNGGNDDDRLNGGVGSDTLTGGAGRDVFVFADTGSTDTVTDFRRGEDKLDFSGLGMSNYIGNQQFHGLAGELRTYSEGRSIFLTGDVDGDGVADFTVALGSNPFTSNDLILASTMPAAPMATAPMTSPMLAHTDLALLQAQFVHI